MSKKITKLIFNSVILSFFLGLVFFANADTAFALDTTLRYGSAPCPTNVVPGGKYNRPVGIAGDSLDVIVDPVFNAKMKKERSTPDLPLTPVYDLVAQVVPQFGFCYTDHPENFPTTPPATLPWKASIMLSDGTTVTSGAFEWKGKYEINPDGTDDTTLPVYEWKIPGWPNGIGGSDKTEKIIASIQQNIPVQIVVEIPQDDGTTVKVPANINFGLCAPIAGSGKNNVDFVGGISAQFKSSDILKKGDSFWFDALGAVEPYASNLKEFAVEAYLGKYNDSWVTTDIVNGTMKNKKLSVVFQNDILNANLSTSVGVGCGGIHIFYTNNLNSTNADAVAVLGNSVGAVVRANPLYPSYTELHEFSHTFAGLNDEYPYKNVTSNTSGLSLTNCSLDKHSEKEGYAHNYKGCSFQSLYRPSGVSIMREVSTVNFNVISCGYIMAAIKGGNAFSYLQFCKDLSGVIADSQGNQLQNLLASVSANFAAVGLALGNIQPQSSLPNLNYAIAESFAADGTITGEFYPAEGEDVLLPDLGLYADKLFALQVEIAKALEALKSERDAALAGQKGGSVLSGEHQFDGPLYLLQKMGNNLQTNDDGSLKDPAGLLKFFNYLKSLNTYNNSDFSGVSEAADNLTGFSYMSTPDPSKPTLIYIPGAGGEPLFKTSELFNSQSDKFNIIGYTSDQTLPYDQVVDTFINKFSEDNLGNTEHLLLPYSMGNNVVLSSILKTTESADNQNLFGNSHVLSLEFLPGGSVKASKVNENLMMFVMSVGMPAYAEVVRTMSPANSEHSQIANNLSVINNSTKDIFYIQAAKDQHIDFSNTNPKYAPNRDLIMSGMRQQGLLTVTPPNTIIKDNPHINILGAPEVKDKINSYINLLSRPQGSISFPMASGFAILEQKTSIVSWLSQIIQIFSPLRIANAAVDSLSVPDFANSVLHGAITDECAWLSEVLEDSMMTEDGVNYEATVSGIKNYLALNNKSCQFTFPTVPLVESTIWGLNGQAQNSGEVLLSWQSIPMTTGDVFEIEREMTGGTQGMRISASSNSNTNLFSKIAETTEDTYLDSGLASSKSYVYRIRQKFSNGTFGAYSNILSIQTTAAGMVAIVGGSATTPSGSTGASSDTGNQSVTSSILSGLSNALGKLTGGLIGTAPDTTIATQQSDGSVNINGSISTGSQSLSPSSISTGVKGKAVDTGNFPEISLAALAKNESLDTSLKCHVAANSNYMTQYWSSASGGMSAFNNSLKDFASCIIGRLMATFYKAQIQDDNGSADRVDTMIKDTNNLSIQANPILQYAKTLTKDFKGVAKTEIPLGLTTFIIPRGFDTPINYPSLKNVSTQCVKDNNTNTSVPEVGVGTTNTQSGSILSDTSALLEKELQDFKSRSAAINAKVVAAGVNFVSGNAKFKSINQEIITLLTDITGKTKTDFFAVLPGDLHNDYRDFENRSAALTFGLEINKDVSGNLIKCDDTTWAQSLVYNFYLVKVTLGGYTYQACLPPLNIAEGLLASFPNTVSDFNDLKSIYTNRITKDTKALADLAKNNYSCSASAGSKTAGGAFMPGSSSGSDTGAGTNSPVPSGLSDAIGQTIPKDNTTVVTLNGDGSVNINGGLDNSQSVDTTGTKAPAGLIPCGTITDSSGKISNPCGFNDIVKLVSNIINFLIYAGMVLSGLAFIYVGWLYLSSGGDESKVKQAKEIVWKVVWGFLAMCGAWLIVKTISSAFIGDANLKTIFDTVFPQ